MSPIRRVRAATAVALLVLAGACADDGDSDAEGALEETSAFASSPCPDDVVAIVSADISCGYLTVPEARGSEDDDVAQIFVLRVKPSGTAAPDPIVVPGVDLGIVPDLDGLAPMAERTGREVFIMEPRGVGHSRPALDCPELPAVAVQLNGRPSSDPQRSRIFLEALGTCHERLTSVGVDLASYGVEESSADVEDLRRAVGVASWNVIAFGSSSRVALEVVRRWPEHVRSLVLDAPSFPGRDVQMAALQDTRRAIDALQMTCDEQPPCALDETSLEAVVASLDASPQRIDVEGSAIAVPGGGPVEVVVDGAAFARTLRFALGSDDRTILPDVLAGMSADALDGRDFSALSSDPSLCVGYAANCLNRKFVTGAYYSSFCRDLLPFADVAAAATAAGSDPIVGPAFSADPQVDACTVWDVPPADASIDEPVSTDIPTLIFMGRFDPYTSRQAAIDATASWSRVTVAESPSTGHNNLGTDCARSIRNSFVDNPTVEPDLSCFRE